MRRGHHVSSVLKALGARVDDAAENPLEVSAAVEQE